MVRVDRWRGVALVMAVVAGMLLAPSMSRAESSQSPIAAKALTYVGTHGGQCWTFMQRVVAETTGKRVVGDYRQAYLQAGAIEVSAENAASGDIIQIAADGNSSAWSSYPGLHTAIVLENLGAGTFNAVDSNQNWDEMVALRPNYNPYTSASRYGLQVHIYRFTPGASVPAAPAVVAPDLSAGMQVVVSAGGDCLNVRSSASATASRLGCIPEGTSLSVLSANAAAAGRQWVQVQTPLGKGWVAAEFLAVASSPAAPAVASAAQAPPAAAAAAASYASATTAIGATQARVDDSPGCLRMRDTPGTSGSILTCLTAGTAVVIGDADRVSADGYEWVQVTAGGKTGWVAAKYLIEP